MRYPEDKIKEAILHSDRDVRVRAAEYFTHGASADATLMPIVIEAIERYGREHAADLISFAHLFPQSEATIGWLIDELNRDDDVEYEGDEADFGWTFKADVANLLLHADAALLMARQADVEKALSDQDDAAKELRERLSIQSWTEEKCWQEFDKATRSKSGSPLSVSKFTRAQQIMGVLARFGQTTEPKIRAYLDEKHDADISPSDAEKLQLVVELAGLTRLESFIPQLVAKFAVENEDVNDAISDALAKIGTPAVLRAVADAYAEGDDLTRHYAIKVLAAIHSDLAVETILELLSEETREFSRIDLMEALLDQFADASVEIARSFLLEEGADLSFEASLFRTKFLETCKLTGWRFPEFDAWSEADEADKERRDSMEGDWDDPADDWDAFDNEVDLPPRDDGPPSEMPPPITLFRNQPLTKQPAGRNDPCPCGSGKKYKKCCMNK